MISRAVHETVSRSEFRAGLWWGCALVAVGIVCGLVSSHYFRRPAPVAGLLLAVAWVKAAAHLVVGHHSGALPDNVTRGLVVLALAGLAAALLGTLWRPLALSGIVFAVPGAVLLTRDTGLPDLHWVAPLVVVTVVVGGTLVADFDRRYRARGWSVVMFVVSIAGVYFTVPDTERALVLLGASLPLALLGWPVVLASIGTAGAYPAVGALAWIAAFEGLGRRSAIVGGVACLGLFVVEPLARWLRLGAATAFDRLPRVLWPIVPVAGAHLLLVYVASRVAGLRATVSEAVAISVVGLVAGVIAVLAVDGVVRARATARVGS